MATHSVETKPLSLLWTYFIRQADGQYAIESMTPIPLRGPDGDEGNFFPVRDGLVTAQPRYTATVLSTLGLSIVPIVAMVPGEGILRCLGTGFFVSADGLLITAAHVVADPIERKYGGVHEINHNHWHLGDLELGVMIMTNPVFHPKAWLFRKIKWAGFLADRTEHPLPFREAELKLNSDVAICKVEDPPDHSVYQPLAIVQKGIRGVGLALGKKAYAIGYHGMKDTTFDQQENIREGDFSFNLHVSIGEVLEHLPDNTTNRRVKTPGACFSASLKLTGGMSGSPIFDDERLYVHGVASGSYREDSFGYGSMLAASMSMPIEPMGNVTLLQLIGEGKHGIPRISIAGA